jgi:predicted HNH restriction endonuclease
LLGGDVEENLITLCARCHRQIHERRANILFLKDL